LTVALLAAGLLAAGSAPVHVLAGLWLGMALASALSDLLHPPLTCKESPLMAGYANRIIHLDFPDLAEDDDKVWVAILNPKQQPPDKVQPRPLKLDENGRPADAAEAVEAMYETIAGLVVAWHVYDATAPAIDYDTGEQLDQPLLPKVDQTHPATVEMVRKLPMEIVNTIGKRMTEAVNPQ
jgi:hypothetical protein